MTVLFGNPAGQGYYTSTMSPDKSSGNNELNYAVFVLSTAPILDNILSYLGSGDILRMKRLCYAIYDEIQLWEKSAYSINWRLRTFFDDPIAFRVIQARTDMLISGSFALQFLDRTYYPEGDLDLYASAKHAAEVAFWILSQGYEYIHNEEADSSANALQEILDHITTTESQQPPWAGTYPMKPLCRVLTFLRSDSTKLKVQLILCQADYPPVACVFFFHSTCVMNYISWNKAVSMYPSATFDHRQSLVLCMTGGFATASRKYTRRGFQLISRMLVEQLIRVNPTCTPFKYGPRAVGDRDSWVVNLDTKGLTDIIPSKIPKLKLELDSEMIVSWHLGSGAEYGSSQELGYMRNPETGMGIAASLISTRLFENKYLVHPGLYGDSEEWRREQMRMEKLKFDGGDTIMGSSDTWSVSQTQSNRWQPPAGWYFWDKEFVAFHRAFLEDLRRGQFEN